MTGKAEQGQRCPGRKTYLGPNAAWIGKEVGSVLQRESRGAGQCERKVQCPGRVRPRPATVPESRAPVGESVIQAVAKSLASPLACRFQFLVHCGRNGPRLSGDTPLV